MEMSWTLIAGVNWSLRYEWAFYVIGLPLLFVLSRFLSRNALLVASLALLTAAIVTAQLRGGLHGSLLYVVHFLCGITSAFVYENALGRRIISSRAFHGLAALSLVVLGIVPDSGKASVLVVSMLFFLATIGGLSCFGLLATRSAVWLGDISYGIYLTHGMVLWMTYYVCKRTGVLADLNSRVHWRAYGNGPIGNDGGDHVLFVLGKTDGQLGPKTGLSKCPTHDGLTVVSGVAVTPVRGVPLGLCLEPTCFLFLRDTGRHHRQPATRVSAPPRHSRATP
jgi:hypothetical protein